MHSNRRGYELMVVRTLVNMQVVSLDQFSSPGGMPCQGQERRSSGGVYGKPNG